MNTKEIIGRTITDILAWYKTEIGGLDKAEVFIQLDNEKTIVIPWDFESKNLETKPRRGSISIFSNMDDITEYHVNIERKAIQEVIEARKRRESSVLGLIKKALGLGEKIPKEYKVYKIVTKENNLKYLKNQKIVDFLMFDDYDSAGFFELENGYIITETRISPNGTGASGLNYFENLKSFEQCCGTDYIRLKSN
jgi:hypothetical protein